MARAVLWKQDITRQLERGELATPETEGQRKVGQQRRRVKDIVKYTLG